MPEDKNEDKKLPASISGASGDLLTRALGPAADEFGILFGDKIRAYRLNYRRHNNIEAIAEKVLLMLGDLPQRNAPLSLKTALPIFEYASLEEGDYLREKWAALLASNLLDDVPHYFSDILRQLTPLDVKILDIVYNACNSIPKINLGMHILNGDDVITALSIDKESYDLSVLNLIRLELCHYPQVTSVYDIGGEWMRKEGVARFRMTKLGFAFAAACKSPKEKRKDDEGKS